MRGAGSSSQFVPLRRYYSKKQNRIISLIISNCPSLCCLSEIVSRLKSSLCAALRLISHRSHFVMLLASRAYQCSLELCQQNKCDLKILQCSREHFQRESSGSAGELPQRFLDLQYTSAVSQSRNSVGGQNSTTACFRSRFFKSEACAKAELASAELATNINHMKIHFKNSFLS